MDQRKPMRRTYRTVWVSDTHLGTKEARTDFLLDFLGAIECERLYLVGDIFDLWSMHRAVCWDRCHNELLRRVLEMTAGGTRVIYIPGNHDALLRDHAGLDFGRITVRREAIHTTGDGRRLLVIHGDEFEAAVQCGNLGGLIGSTAYDWLLRFSHWVYLMRRRLGLSYWSLAAYLKGRVSGATAYIERFQQAVLREVRHRQVDGLVCGHIHRATVTELDGFLYANTGDWVESCTALVEHENGALELLHWSDHRYQVDYRPPTRAGDAAETVCQIAPQPAKKRVHPIH